MKMLCGGNYLYPLHHVAVHEPVSAVQLGKGQGPMVLWHCPSQGTTWLMAIGEREEEGGGGLQPFPPCDCGDWLLGHAPARLEKPKEKKSFLQRVKSFLGLDLGKD